MRIGHWPAGTSSGRLQFWRIESTIACSQRERSVSASPPEPGCGEASAVASACAVESAGAACVGDLLQLLFAQREFFLVRVALAANVFELLLAHLLHRAQAPLALGLLLLFLRRRIDLFLALLRFLHLFGGRLRRRRLRHFFLLDRIGLVMISCATGCGGVGASSGRGSGLGCSIGAVSCGAGVACSGRLASARRIDADNALGSISVASITGPRWISSALAPRPEQPEVHQREQQHVQQDCRNQGLHRVGAGLLHFLTFPVGWLIRPARGTLARVCSAVSTS